MMGMIRIARDLGRWKMGAGAGESSLRSDGNEEPRKDAFRGSRKGETQACLGRLISKENPETRGCRGENTWECREYYVRVHEGFKVHG
ncbi:hypothetical protein E2C01_006786 [Portunus trituberculatus]|uniref:Uncharacterized protein n=1 Tax=Portunus trituberculatus TaxID=210409 RepID=A0A5B7D2S0_PORTR|nr:hypothetical protein [Portunus trituberculatus]